MSSTQARTHTLVPLSSSPHLQHVHLGQTPECPIRQLADVVALQFQHLQAVEPLEGEALDKPNPVPIEVPREKTATRSRHPHRHMPPPTSNPRQGLQDLREGHTGVHTGADAATRPQLLWKESIREQPTHMHLAFPALKHRCPWWLCGKQVGWV